MRSLMLPGGVVMGCEEQAEAYAAVLPLIASGEIVPAHDRSFPLEAAPEALRHLIEDRPFGTVTLSVGG
jgi:NADPH:quinone reductase